MSEKFEFIGEHDRPALLAFSAPAWLETARTAAQELGYLVHTAATHGDFSIRFSQVRYQLVLIEECFAANSLAENATLQELQTMPMNQRRHATVILLGNSFQTFTPMQAFQQSVNAVINGSELFLLKQLIEQAVSDNARFLRGFNEAQRRVFGQGQLD
jgi:hypothetical protein